MIRIRKPLAIPIVCSDRQLAAQWYDALKEVGIPVIPVCRSIEFGELAINKAILLIQPDFEQRNDYSLFLNKWDKPVFLLTDDVRWQKLETNVLLHFVPEATHPLELARLLVEKLNLPLLANKQTYAFSFFSF